jgi:hypothetical protein
MNGHDFLRVASILASGRAMDEAIARTAVSRAYYGAFHITIEYFDALGVQSFGHGEPRHLLAASKHDEAMTAGNILADLQNARVRADYKLDDRSINMTVARKLIESAFEFRDLIDKCSEPVAMAEIQEVLVRYIAQRRGPK